MVARVTHPVQPRHIGGYVNRQTASQLIKNAEYYTWLQCYLEVAKASNPFDKLHTQDKLSRCSTVRYTPSIRCQLFSAYNRPEL